MGDEARPWPWPSQPAREGTRPRPVLEDEMAESRSLTSADAAASEDGEMLGPLPAAAASIGDPAGEDEEAEEAGTGERGGG